MASTSNLRSRRSAAQLHALAGVEREIRVRDSHNRRKYLRDFNQAFRNYESVLDADQLRDSVRSADIVLIGDYHALPPHNVRRRRLWNNERSLEIVQLC